VARGSAGLCPRQVLRGARENAVHGLRLLWGPGSQNALRCLTPISASGLWEQLQTSPSQPMASQQGFPGPLAGAEGTARGHRGRAWGAQGQCPVRRARQRAHPRPLAWAGWVMYKRKASGPSTPFPCLETSSQTLPPLPPRHASPPGLPCPWGALRRRRGGAHILWRCPSEGPRACVPGALDRSTGSSPEAPDSDTR